MSNLSYISAIDRYHEYRDAIRELLGSIISGIADKQFLEEKTSQCQAMQMLGKIYPFVDLLYVLDENGVQISDNIAVTPQHFAAYQGKGKDRNQRPYYKLAKDTDQIVVTEPYLSSVNRDLCISAAIKVKCDSCETAQIVVIDIDLTATIEFLMGDTARRKFQPFFKLFYTIISVGLLFVVISLMFSAFSEILALFPHENTKETQLKPFGIIIFLTLGLAIFDLGKTIFEEEVLMHKDVFRHSSTRRTITRFIAAILIAVSIESLLLMFKSALGYSGEIESAVWMMIAAVGLLIGLGLYVYLGAKAEAILTGDKRKSSVAN